MKFPFRTPFILRDQREDLRQPSKISKFKGLDNGIHVNVEILDPVL